MLKIEKSTNRNKIENILFDKDIYPTLFRTLNVKQGDKNLFSHNVKHFLFYENNIPFGVASFLPCENKIAEADIAILPKFRGKKAFKVASQMKKLYFSQYECNVIRAIIHKENKASLYFVLLLGFKIINKTNIQVVTEAKKE
jgi:hypothetical protein